MNNGRASRSPGGTAASSQLAYRTDVTDAPTPDDPSPGPEASPTDEAASVVSEPHDGLAPGAGRRRRLRIVAAAVVVVLVAAGGVVGWQVLTPDPRDVAKEYFTRLAAGDANGALRAIDKSSIGADLPTSDLLLTDAALRDPASRPKAMTITHVAQAGDTATMTVQYQANSSTVTQTLKAQRRGRGFALESPLVRLTFVNLDAADSAAVTVNGVAVHPAKADVAFPGAYAVTADGNALFAGRSAAAVPSPNATAAIVLPPPSLSAEGRTKADAAVAAALQQCAANHFQPQPTCPEIAVFPTGFAFDPAMDIPLPPNPQAGPVVVTTATSQTTIKVTRLPVCAYAPDANSVDHVTFSSADGVIHWDIHLTLANGTVLASKSGDTPIAPKGRVGLNANGQIQVTFA